MPLHIAALGGHIEVVRVLLRAGANREAALRVSGTAAHITIVAQSTWGTCTWL